MGIALVTKPVVNTSLHKGDEGDILLAFHVYVEDLSVQLIKCYKGQLYINIQDKATSVIAIVPK